MALRELGCRSSGRLRRHVRPCIDVTRRRTTRNAFTEPTTELEPDSSFNGVAPSEDALTAFDPVARSRARKRELPPSRYQFRPPKHYRGPFHPHQPPKPSDPASRLFVPGPFALPRIEQTFDSTIAPDIMTMAYTHFPPGYRAPVKEQRLREWVGDSPYFKNRPLRKPRGGDVLPLLWKPITFRNVPHVTGVTLHSMVKEAKQNSSHLHVAGMVMQAISNVRVETHVARKSVAGWALRPGRYISVTAEMNREDSLHFLSKCIDMVLPRIKDWKGVRGTSGDSSGNIAFGLSGDQVALFPEIEINYDMYPPKMIPGCHIIVKTSATNDRDARLLLGSIGIPFYGKRVD